MSNRHSIRERRQWPLGIKPFLASFLLLLAAVLILPAQNRPSYAPPPENPPTASKPSADSVSAGGNWREYDTEDKMTAAHRVKFELLADNTLRDSRSSQPRVELFCESGSLKHSSFDPGVRLAPPNRPGFWGQPKMDVRVRVNNSHSDHGWNWEGNSLSMDKGTTRELIGSDVFKIQFMAYGGPQIAEFSPAGLNRERVAKACGITPKKP